MTLVSPPPLPSQTHRTSGGLRVIITVIFLVLGAFLIYLLVSAKNQSKAASGKGGNRPVTIATATATKGDIGKYINQIGTVTPVQTALIYAQVTGVVKTVFYKEGQSVNEGDPLVDIDDRPYMATLEQAEGTLLKDQHLLAQAQNDLKRYEAALAQNAIPVQTVDDQRELVQQDMGLVQNDQGAVDYDKTQVAYCHIKAPFAGRVGLRLVDVGNLVVPGASSNANPLVVITQLQPITVVFSIPEGKLEEVMAQLKKASTLKVEAYDSGDTTKLADGKFLALDTLIDTTTGTVKVRAQFPNDDLVLFPNQFVNAHLLVETLTGVTLLPSSAIQQNGDTSFVYIIQSEGGGKVAKVRDVKVGVQDQKLGISQVVEGINPGDVVANSSFDKLDDGSKVNVESSKPGEAGKSPGAEPSASPEAKRHKSPAPGASASPSPGASSSPGASPSSNQPAGGGS